MCNSQYKQAKMIGNVVDSVNYTNTLMSIYCGGNCAIYLSILK